MNFEEKIKRMEEICILMQKSETGLDESVKLYEEGMRISKEVESELCKIERRIEIVTSSDEDGVITEPYPYTGEEQ